MPNKTVTGNRAFLTDLFAGPFRGHAILMDPPLPPVDWSLGDFITSPRPLSEWAGVLCKWYEDRVRWHEETGDDAVPYVPLLTGTELFAAAFGCQVHCYPDILPCALPLVTSGEEADRLIVPELSTSLLSRVFEMGHLLRQELGRDVILGVPDIQSPFDIAALIWRKEDLFVALYEEPDAVKRLVAKCQTLLTSFLREFLRQFPSANLCHCPYAWAPSELGLWLSEDEAGSLTTPMFEEFCLPSLLDLDREFGGLFMHCCATADHQYASFRKIPRLRGLNRVFQSPGPRPAIETFAGHAVLMIAWNGEEEIHRLLDMALPGTRFLFDLPVASLDDPQNTYARLRKRCPRV